MAKNFSCHTSHANLNEMSTREFLVSPRQLYFSLAHVSIRLLYSNHILREQYAPSDYALLYIIFFLQCLNSDVFWRFQHRERSPLRYKHLVLLFQIVQSGCCGRIVLYCIYKYCIVIVFNCPNILNCLLPRRVKVADVLRRGQLRWYGHLKRKKKKNKII